MRTKLCALVTCLLALGVGLAADDDFRLRVLDETVPAGGIVQMKVRTYEVSPISGGRGWVRSNSAIFRGVEGVGIFATTGEVAGAAVAEGDGIALTYVTTEPFATDDYPFLTVALRVRDDVTAGTRSTLTFDPASLWNVNGTLLRAEMRSGVLRIGGSVAISNIFPGQGVQPAGTVGTVRGLGFKSGSRLKIDGVNIGSVRVVSSTEIRFTLRDTADMTGRRVRVDNPDGSRSEYYSYTRGIPAATSSRTLLAGAEPIFSGTTRAISTLGPVPDMTTAQYFAVALQNPMVATADVTIGLYDADGVLIHSTNRSLQGGHRLALEVSELLDGVPPPAGASVQVTSAVPLGVFGLLCDDAAWQLTPLLPVEANDAPD